MHGDWRMNIGGACFRNAEFLDSPVGYDSVLLALRLTSRSKNQSLTADVLLQKLSVMILISKPI